MSAKTNQKKEKTTESHHCKLQFYLQKKREKRQARLANETEEQHEQRLQR